MTPQWHMPMLFSAAELAQPERKVDFRLALISQRGCEYHTSHRRGGRSQCGHNARLFRVNHLVVSLCLCHAAQLAARRNVEVAAA